MKRSNHVKTPATPATPDSNPAAETPARLNIEVPLDKVVGGQVSRCTCEVCQCRCLVA